MYNLKTVCNYEIIEKLRVLKKNPICGFSSSECAQSVSDFAVHRFIIWSSVTLGGNILLREESKMGL